MAGEKTGSVVVDIHSAILDAIRAQFPDLRTVAAYHPERERLALPACLVELEELEASPDDDPGTEQLAVEARFCARLVIGFRHAPTPAKLEIRRLAAAFAAWARLQRWGLPVGPVEIIGAAPDDFSPELEQYECWRVEWKQTLHLGESVWQETGITPVPYLSWVPEIGEAHKDAYQPGGER